MTDDALRLVGFQPIALTAPYIRPDTAPDHKANGHRNCVWLRLEAEDGTVGWGEAYWGAYATQVTVSALERCRQYVVGASALDPAAMLRDVRFRTRYWAMRGLGAQALSALEAAAWDIYAQKVEQPLWQVLGGTAAAPVRIYASSGDDALEPGEIRAQARRYVDAGFQAYKMRCGGRAGDHRHDMLERDVERVAAARDALGDGRLLAVDVTVPQRPDLWPLGRAEEYVDALAPFDLAFLEEPAPTYDVAGYAALRARGGVPIAGGESFTSPDEYLPFLAADAYDVVQPDAAVVGGPASCVAVGRMALDRGAQVAVHAWSAGVGLAQNLHAAAAIGDVLVLEWPQSAHPTATVPLEAIYQYDSGYLLAPELPGLGVAITEEFLERFAYRPGFERDY